MFQSRPLLLSRFELLVFHQDQPFVFFYEQRFEMDVGLRFNSLRVRVALEENACLVSGGIVAEPLTESEGYARVILALLGIVHALLPSRQ